MSRILTIGEAMIELSGAGAEASGGAPKLILMATGSELHLAVGGREKLEAEGVPTRVVSMPCWEFFDAREFLEGGARPAGTRLGVPMAATFEVFGMGWGE